MRNKISGYTLTYNCIEGRFPLREAIQSHLGFCSEIIIIDDDSTDGTYELLQELASKNGRLKLFKANKKDIIGEHQKVYSGSYLKTLGRQKCTGDFLWQFDADEIVHEDDYGKIDGLCDSFPANADVLILPVVEFWGSKGKCRVDINPWKWRLSRNDKNIIHGIPKQSTAYDSNGNMFSLGSDGDDYIFKDTMNFVRFASVYNQNIENVRQALLADPNNAGMQKAYETLMARLVSNFPAIYHYSWFSMERKISSYKTYWRKHWANFFNLDGSDTAENNVMFDKPWEEVTDEDIKVLADKMESEMGGWIFHKKIDFTKKTPWFKLAKTHPKVMEEWIRDNK